MWRPDATAPPDPDGSRRILVVEDEAIVAALLAEQLRLLGFAVIGPCGTVDAALASARGDPLDGAILDVNLAGRPAWPVASALAGRAIPFVLASGSDPVDLPDAFAARPRLVKPYGLRALRTALATLLGA